MVLKYKLLKELLDWHPGYIIELSATGKFGWLGSGDYGWELPIEILHKYPDWFFPIITT